MAKICWTSALSDYLSDGTLSYQGIAQKYSVSLQAVKKHAKAESWQELRLQHKQLVTQKLPELTSTDSAQVKALHARLASRLLAKVDEVLSNDKLKIQSYRELTALVKVGVEIHREALDLQLEPLQPQPIVIRVINTDNRLVDLSGI